MQFKTLVIALIAGIAAATPVEETQAGVEAEARGGPRGGGGRGYGGRGGGGRGYGGRGYGGRGYYGGGYGGPGWVVPCDPFIQYCGP
jgi:uncharacterized membrane protein